jgi:hypothetical protein
MIAVSRPATACYHAWQYQKDARLGKLKTMENLFVAILMQDDSNSVSQMENGDCCLPTSNTPALESMWHYNCPALSYGFYRAHYILTENTGMAMSAKILRLIHKCVQHISTECAPRELYWSFISSPPPKKRTFTEYSVIKDKINVTHQTN